MKKYCPPTTLKLLFLIVFALGINYSCTKDNDMLEESVLDPAIEGEDQNIAADPFIGEAYLSEEDLLQMGFETRTAIFTPLSQAEQDTTEVDGQLTGRPEKDHGYLYLTFDLGPIDAIGGTLDAAKLQFSVADKNRKGTVSVFKGNSKDWTENSRSQSSENASEPIALLGNLNIETSQQNQEIHLETSQIHPEVLTLVIPRTEDIDLTLASEENNDHSDPALVVTYLVPRSAKALPEDQKVAQEADPTTSTSNNETLKAVYATARSGNQYPDSRPSASTTYGSAPLKVQFGKGNSSDDKGIASYKWFFMDGTTATGPNPSHTFTKPGTYRVILSIKDAEGLENGRIIIITVTGGANRAPDSRPSANITKGKAPLKVQFGKGNSSDDKGIVSYKWYFMDGTTSKVANPSHTFTTPGTYRVILSLKDQEGLENGRILVITVTGGANKPPDARPDATPASGNAPLKVQFGSSKSSDDTGITSYNWDFKDGSKTTGARPSHTFTEPGTYKVVLTATDKGGLTNARIVVVTVKGTSSRGSSSSITSSSSSSTTQAIGKNPTNGVKASTFGYNSSNATNALKAAINSSNSTIIVDRQSGDWIVDPLYFDGLRNKTIVFEDGVVLRARNGAYRNSDRLFQLVNSSNVQIIGYGATLKMNKSAHSGQQNHVLSLVSSSNITIKGLTVRDGGGDGLYISRYREGEYCSNIRIEDVISTNNQRQGITIVSVDGLVVKNSTFSRSNGQSPGAGVDFESESVRDRFTNIIFDNCGFRDNNGPGVMTAFSKTSSSSIPLDITFNNSYLTNNSLSNPRSYPTEIELGMSTYNINNPIKGTITFNGLTVENSRWGAIFTKKTAEAYNVVVKNAVIKNVSKGSNKAAIHIGLLGYGNTSTANMGGFTFENVLIDYDGVDPSLELFGPGHGNWNLKNMRGSIRVKSPRGVKISDNMNKLTTTNSSTVTLKVVKN